MARPKTRAERQRSFSTLKDPRMDSDGAFRDTKPLPDKFDELVVKPHLFMDTHTVPLRGGHPVPASERHKYLPLPQIHGRLEPVSHRESYRTIADILKRATIDDTAAVVGKFATHGNGDRTRAWGTISLLYCEGPMSAQQVSDRQPGLEDRSGTRTATYLSKLYRSGLLEIDGESRHANTGHRVRTYRLSDETTAAVQSLVTDIRRRSDGDSDDGGPVPDAGRVRTAAATAVHRLSGTGVSAASGVSAEGDD